MLRQEREVCKILQEVSVRSGQRKGNGVAINGNAGDVVGRALSKFLRALDVAEAGGKGGGNLCGFQRSFDVPDNIVCRQRLAIGPLQTILQDERIGHAIVGDGIAFCHVRLPRCFSGVGNHQTAIHQDARQAEVVPGELHLFVAGVRVQIKGLRGVSCLFGSVGGIGFLLLGLRGVRVCRRSRSIRRCGSRRCARNHTQNQSECKKQWNDLFHVSSSFHIL